VFQFKGKCSEEEREKGGVGRLLVDNWIEGGGLVCGTPRGGEEGGSGGQQRRTTGRGDGWSSSAVRQGKVERGVRAHETGEFGHR
jgi:hypothetical protein